jgi:hypothetical protein
MTRSKSIARAGGLEAEMPTTLANTLPGGGHEGNDEIEADEIDIPDPPVREVMPASERDSLVY